MQAGLSGLYAKSGLAWPTENTDFNIDHCKKQTFESENSYMTNYFGYW